MSRTSPNGLNRSVATPRWWCPKNGPVPLEQHVLVQADDHTEPELIDLYRRDKDGNQTDKLNAQLVSRLDQLDRKAAKRRGEQRPDRRKGGKGGKWNDHSRRPERHTPRRWAVIDELNFLGILPGIYFIFSRQRMRSGRRTMHQRRTRTHHR